MEPLHLETELSTRPFLALILAAGKGTRMKSDLAKVLHPIGGRSLLAHVVALARETGASRLGVVIGPDMANVGREARAGFDNAELFVQHQQNGTADAVLAARDMLQSYEGDIAVLYGDTPLITSKTINQLRQTLSEGADVCVIGFETDTPGGYGRLLMGDEGVLLSIREEKDASPDELNCKFCNSGVMGFRAGHLLPMLDEISNDNASGEYYLTDVVEIARAKGLNTAAISCPESEVMGVNSRVHLAEADAIFQNRMRAHAMAEGATLMAPETVYFSYDTRLGRDVIIEPNVFFGAGVVIDDGAYIKAFSHFENVSIGPDATVGPYARLRPGAEIKSGARVGNFVEIKNAVIEPGAKVNHLSYVGDAQIGEGANIGAGTITCNYDGFRKHRTEIGARAFIGSNSALVAPVKIGDGAFVGSGSVITKDVEADALAIARGSQEVRPGWAAKFRALMSRAKKKAV